MTEVVRKITVKTVLGAKPGPFPEDAKMGDVRHLTTVIGRADSFKEEVSYLPDGTQSPYLRFRGQFAAWKGEMGSPDDFRSAVMILPPVAADLLAGALGAENVNSVEFAYRIGVKKADTPTGYQYTCEPLIEEAEDTDPIAALMKRAGQKALPKGGKAA